jgi:hypothetical protein
MNLKQEEELVKEAKAKGRKLGNCYQCHYEAILHSQFREVGLSEFVSNLDSLRLCHGTVEHPNVENPRHGHAWLEADDICVFISNGKFRSLPTFTYYSLGKIQDVNRYTLKEAASWAVKTGHYGPWE